ncbi:resistin-like alpha [Alexandromys fortis]|uniref:resistin-like alpha n=1 Tax=Alexandromys fortis TaxID=100897 RepID=UPI002152E3C5|nr:resistin-like alpha [Microtus fortis]XP_050004872.1 resistin-like alpha [Microtus fortis]
MKTTTCSLLIIISFLQLMVPVNTEETLDSVMKKLKEARSLERPPSAMTKSLSCTTIKASGTPASCPPGMIATGCSCSFLCGDVQHIQNENICYCLCSNVDWTIARCCQQRK